MARERIHFPESLIPDVIRVIRRGLEDEENEDLRHNLEKQCEELEGYWKRMWEDR